MALKELLVELQDKMAESKVDPTACDPRVRSGAEGMVRQAKIAVEKIENLYKAEVIKTAVIVAVDGKGAEKFAEISREAVKTIAVDFHFIIDDIAATIKKHSRNADYNTNEHSILTADLLRIRKEYGITHMQSPTINYTTDGIYLSPIKQAIKAVLDKNYGVSLYSTVSRVKIAQMALEAKFEGKSLPVIIYNCDGQVDNLMLTTPVASYTFSEEEVDEALVRKVWSEVKQQFKTNNQ